MSVCVHAWVNEWVGFCMCSHLCTSINIHMCPSLRVDVFAKLEALLSTQVKNIDNSGDFVAIKPPTERSIDLGYLLLYIYLYLKFKVCKAEL